MLSLLAAALLTADPVPPPPPPPPPVVEPAPAPAPAAPAVSALARKYSGKPREWLLVERDQLLVRKPPLAPQLVVLGGALFGGAVSMGIGFTQQAKQGSAEGIMFAIAVGCGVVATVAAVLLGFGLRERFDIDEKLQAVDEAMVNAPEYQQPPPPPQPMLPAPPPPPPGA